MTTKIHSFRRLVLSIAPLVCAVSFVPQAHAQQSARPVQAAQLQTIVFNGATQHGWYLPAAQRPKLKFTGNELKITSRGRSMVMLSQREQVAGLAAEVWLTHAPVSTSSITGLGVMGDADHALVIGLAGGDVILWQLDPDAARVVARTRVNATSPVEFRVIGEQKDNARFFWRHRGDKQWHPLGSSSSDTLLASWHRPMHLGLLLDGPRGSQATFTDYHTFSADQVQPRMMAAVLQ